MSTLEFAEFNRVAGQAARRRERRRGAMQDDLRQEAWVTIQAIRQRYPDRSLDEQCALAATAARLRLTRYHLRQLAVLSSGSDHEVKHLRDVRVESLYKSSPEEDEGSEEAHVSTGPAEGVAHGSVPVRPDLRIEYRQYRAAVLRRLLEILPGDDADRSVAVAVFMDGATPASLSAWMQRPVQEIYKVMERAREITRSDETLYRLVRGEV